MILFLILHPSILAPTLPASFNSIPSPHSHCCFRRQTRKKEGTKTRDDDIDRPIRRSENPTDNADDIYCPDSLRRSSLLLSSANDNEDGDGGIDCCKTVKTTNCGRERRGGGRRLGRRLRVPPSAVKYIQEAFECV